MKNSGSGPKYETSPTPVFLRYASAFFAMFRGSRLYSSLVIGSTMLQVSDNVGFTMKGSITAVAGSGMASMSDALIGCQPRIDEPSRPEPSSKSSSFSSLVGMVKCCQVPSRSQNFKSTASALFSLANLSTSFGVCGAMRAPPRAPRSRAFEMGSDRGAAALSRTDPDDLVDRQDEDLAVADAAGLRDLLVADDDLELHLGQKVHDVLRPSVELRVTLLAPEALDLGDGESLDSDAGETFLHLIELERLDDRLDLFHGRASTW